MLMPQFPTLPLGEWKPVFVVKKVSRWSGTTGEWLAVRAIQDELTGSITIESMVVEGPVGEPYFATKKVSVWHESLPIEREWLIRDSWETESSVLGLQRHELFYRLHVEGDRIVANRKVWPPQPEPVYP